MGFLVNHVRLAKYIALWLNEISTDSGAQSLLQCAERSDNDAGMAVSVVGLHSSTTNTSTPISKTPELTIRRESRFYACNAIRSVAEACFQSKR